MKTAEINLAGKAARVITAIENMNADNPKLKDAFDAATSAEEKEQILDLKVIFATRAEDFVNKAESLDATMASKLITLAELEASVMARAIGDIEARSFADENQRSQEVSDGFAKRGAKTLAALHKPS
jgi:hypothetical protein